MLPSVNFDLDDKDHVRTELAEVRTCPKLFNRSPAGFFLLNSPDDLNQYESLLELFEDLFSQDGNPQMVQKTPSFGSVDHNFALQEDFARSHQTAELNKSN